MDTPSVIQLDPVWMDANPQFQETLLALHDELRITLARRDVNAFSELVGRDEESGAPLRQAPIQRSFHELASLHDRLVIWSHVEAGKALPLDTPIPTPTGWTTMGALRVGDTVFDQHGAPCTVTAATAVQYGRAVYRIGFDDGSEIHADADHRWIAATLDDAKLGRWRVVTTAEMLAAGTHRVSGAKHPNGARYPQHKWRIPLAGAVQFHHRQLPVHPYILGAWLGDGDRGGATLTFHKNDREVYDRCVALYGFGTTPRPDSRNPNVLRGVIGGKSTRSGARSERLRSRLTALGVLNNKHIPAEYLTASVEQRFELLAGLLDTDGSVDPRKGRVEFSNTNPRIARGVLELVRSLGFKATVTEKWANLYGRCVGVSYRVCFTPGVPVFRLARKLAGQRLGTPYGRAGYRCIRAITPVTSVPVRCISVDSPGKTYLAGRDFTVTHNTSAMSVLRPLWELGRDKSLRVVIISRSNDLAMKIVRTIKSYVETSEDLARVFPHLRPGTKWTDTALTFAGARVGAKDFSIQAYGIGSTIQGGRVDLAILDDVLDWYNSRTGAQRQEVIDWYWKQVSPRLTGRARVVVVGNAWHPDDLMHHLAGNASWVARTFPVIDPATGEPRWPERWPLERIKKWEKEHGSSEAARVLYCRARSDEDARFKQAWIDRCLDNGEGRAMPHSLKLVPPGYRTYTGVDLSTGEAKDTTVIFSIVVHPNGAREVLAIDQGKWSGPEIVRRILDHHRRYLSIVSVESNQAQAFIRQFALEVDSSAWVRNFNTGANKTSAEFGVETLAVEMERGQWIIPSRARRPLTREVDGWLRDILHYSPAAHTPDTLIAQWIAREGARSKPPRRVRSGKQNLLRR